MHHDSWHARSIRLLVCVALWSRAVPAQSDAPPESLPDTHEGPVEPAPELAPPALLERVESEYPSAARAAHLEASVLLELTVDKAGRVTAARVVEPAGHGFDEAAQAATRRFVFAPARRAGEPVAARFLYRYEFRLPQAPPVTPAVPASVARPRSPPEARAPVEVEVRGASEADRRRRSAEAVTVVETERARRESADLGSVLARTQGIGVRRSGGLGSSTRLSLGGLTDDQVRFFVDGVPLELAGYPFGVANVPVNAVERIEVYSGVVPVRFGADALGGAVNLVTDQDRRESRFGASYEIGSFDTQRVTASGKYVHPPSGLFTRVHAFFDYSRNDYPIDVSVADELGQPSAATVHRFHDAYRAGGATAQVGFVDRRWAKRLLLQLFATEYAQELQHNIAMTVPYGDASYGESARGASLRYEQRIARGVRLDGALGYTYQRGHFEDVGTCAYDWFGRCIAQVNGETGNRPYDRVQWDHAVFARVHFTWQPLRSHTVRLAVAPTYVMRRGNERLQTDPSARDPLTADRELLTQVTGLEYEVDAWGDRLETITFLKDYVQRLESVEPPRGSTRPRFERDAHRVGAGAAVRYHLTQALLAKASYEWATRLPTAREVFGDNRFIEANLDLSAETSHNVNVGFALDARDIAVGSVRGSLNGFLREADQLIVLGGNERTQQYQNLHAARSLGGEGALGVTSPGDYVAVDGNVTYVDYRNTSRRGAFGEFAGDRIPNRPYLFANGSLRVQQRGAVAARDEASLTWTTSYVHAFYRGWESVGLLGNKQEIPAQLVHSLIFGYLIQSDATELSTTLEVHNLTDERVYDFFGVQRPGRAFYAKASAELW